MPELIGEIFAHKITISLFVCAIFWWGRLLVIRAIRQKAEVLSEQQRRWISYTKNSAIFLIILALIVVWWPELRQFALSIAAVAVAFVVASKELILCISGAVLRTTSGASSVGDWIEINGIRGEVTDQNILSTIIQEIDQENHTYHYTGKTITLPNSMFLTYSVKNMNFMRRFVFHRFSICTEPDVNVFEAKQLVLDKMQEYCEEFMEVGKRYHAVIVKRSGLDIPSPEPSVRINTSNIGKNIFSVTLFCPTPMAMELEQKITQDFFAFYYANKDADSKNLEAKG